MKVSNVSIVKAESSLEAIKVALDDFFNPNHAALVINNLIESDVINNLIESDKSVFTSLLVDDSLSHSTRNITEYFICSSLPFGLTRVENCTNIEWVGK